MHEQNQTYYTDEFEKVPQKAKRQVEDIIHV